MLDKIIATSCILDDLLHILHHPTTHNITDSEILTIAILACQEFGGNMRKALHLFSFVPSESRCNRRLHHLMPLLHALAPLVHALWQHLEPCTAYALDTFPMPVCENIRANRCRLAPDKAFRGYKPAHRCYFHEVFGGCEASFCGERGFVCAQFVAASCSRGDFGWVYVEADVFCLRPQLQPPA